jgi:hypothetical protein
MVPIPSGSNYDSLGDVEKAVSKASDPQTPAEVFSYAARVSDLQGM